MKSGGSLFTTLHERKSGMKIFITVLTAIVFSLPNVSHAITTQGAVSCGDWTGRRTPGGNVMASYSTWVLGYLSGRAVESKLDVLRYLDSRTIALWMDSYCQENPLSNTTEAGNSYFAELAKRSDPPANP
jgi:hypothetical protein